ncbi:MAG: ribonuclease H-like domain-containing protein [Treponema sp.]|jgi:uncharacterized protein YprB with RNaseH-like and TPR domain|nr:ribonuclease H-like domain-containing protein [Treponema sp.]
MGNNLRDRLRRIREAGQGAHSPQKTAPFVSAPGRDQEQSPPVSAAGLGPGWSPAGYQTLKRSVLLDLSRPPPVSFSPNLGFILPDLVRYAGAPYPGGGSPPGPGALLFFDLETTGLSGGAGTVAFLAAFGRFVPETLSGRAVLRVTQYLLLDYPGEYDFLEALLSEFQAGPGGDGRFPLTVTYNGKSFDSQIVKTRCLMNGLEAPVFYHADLLHPGRRLWKRVLPNCSQATVETLILGLDRTGDTPGELAPDIWFSFLRSGDPSALLGVCDHNVKDIFGLAALFLAFADIAERPLEAEAAYRCDAEQLALCWRRAPSPSPPEAHAGPLLLRRAAEQGFPRACRQLSVEAEWRRGDYAEALAWTEKGLAAEGLRESLRQDLIRRRERLALKLRRAGTPT